MKITRLEDCEKITVEMDGAVGASRQVPIGKADGAPNFSIPDSRFQNLDSRH